MKFTTEKTFKSHRGSILTTNGTVLINAHAISLQSSELNGMNDGLFSYSLYAQTAINMSSDSSIYFTSSFTSISHQDSHLLGKIIQQPYRQDSSNAYNYLESAHVNISSESGLVSMNSVSTGKMYVHADNIQVTQNGALTQPSNYNYTSCVPDVKIKSANCSINHGNNQMNNSFIISSNNFINVSTSATISSSVIFLCASSVVLEAYTHLSANALGCLANDGEGYGGRPDSSTSTGGGGGAYGGNGGNGYNANNNGGTMYYDSSNAMAISSGSGGGCVDCTPGVSAGGGIVAILTTHLTSNGNITAMGGAGRYQSGGGAGGTIVINTMEMSGGGTITASGGKGGNCGTPGGGGGGGLVMIYNNQDKYPTDKFTYIGKLINQGGVAVTSNKDSAMVTTSYKIPTKLRTNTIITTPTISSISITTDVDKNYTIHSTSPSSSFSSPTSSKSSSSSSSSSSSLSPSSKSSSSLVITPKKIDTKTKKKSASNGSDGIINLPSCNDGYGYNQPTGTICGICQIGTYSNSNTNNQCINCINKPSHSYYTSLGSIQSSCPYNCNAGYVTNECETLFQEFLFGTLGLTGFIIIIIIIIFCILILLLYCRLKQLYIK